MNQLTYLNGRLFEEDFPLRSLFYGEGIFETFRWKKSIPVFWDGHIARMEKGAKVLGIPFPGEEYVKESVETTVLKAGISDGYVKICLLSQGDSTFYKYPQKASLLVIVREYQAFGEPVKAYVSPFIKSSTSPILRLKSLNYLENILARREAGRLGFDEAVFLNEKGEVTEGAASNVFWLHRNVLYTPSLECGLLSGVIRSAVIEIAKQTGLDVGEGHFNLDNLLSSQLAFFTNSLIGALPVSQIDNVELRTDIREFQLIKTTLLKKLGWIQEG